MKKQILSIFFSLFITIIFSQGKYWLSYTDKDVSVYNINNPSAFMSENALARRTKFNIKITITDIPVSQAYKDSVEALGIEIVNSSKWLNGSMLMIDDSIKVYQLENLSFVKSLQKLQTVQLKKNTDKFKISLESANLKESEDYYGTGYNQIKMISGVFLHNLSFKGSGIEIAVMDNGFPDVNTNAFYKKANDENRIRVGWDFVNNNDTLFDNENGNHGNYVISTMVSEVEGELVGTAPEATYYVFSTEDNQNEGLPEEYNWAMAAEKADDLMGEHAIITTSLGYSNGFDISSTNHTYADMDGNTTPITIAADLAASKGFLVINSAGNSGNDAWKYITAPADGDSVLCIGAVDAKGIITNFSSRGPSADGRVKPNVCAKGRNAAGVTKNGTLTTISGTSFSCPITTGMAACLWQAFPEKNNMEIFQAIEKSAHLFSNPNDDYGLGIPNFKLAYFYLLNKDIEENKITIYPNPVETDINFSFKNSDSKEEFTATIYSKTGKKMSTQLFLKNNLLNFYSFNNISNLADGVYILSIVIDKEKITSRFLKK